MSTSLAPPASQLLERYQQLQKYVGLEPYDFKLAVDAWPLIKHIVPALVEDFYEEIQRHEATRKILSEAAQVSRLKKTLLKWVEELFAGVYGEEFVLRRWAVGYRHVQLGLGHVWVSAAMTRLREGLTKELLANWEDTQAGYANTSSAIRRLMDLDLALIEDAYHAESVALQIAHERDFAEGIIETAQAVVILVRPDGTIVRSNAFLTQLLESKTPEATLASGTRPAKLSESPVGNIFDLVSPEQHGYLTGFLAQAASGGQVRPFETDLRLPSGSPRHIRWLARAFVNSPEGSDGPKWEFPQGVASVPNRPRGTSTREPLILCVGQDVTDLAEAQRLLVRQERLAAIGQTMTGLAHESRNAFQRSQASLETLLLELEDRPSAVQLIERIQRAHDHLLHLYEEVLQFARPVRLELQSVRIVGLLQQTWLHVQQTGTTGGIELDVEANVADDEVQADPFMIEQVFRNLLENAVQASEKSTRITATIADAWVGGFQAVEVVISDRGRGIPAEYLERLFEPFFTTRSRGTGLGLPIARRLVESHGGTLRIESIEGAGAKAILILPRRAVPEKSSNYSGEDTRRTHTPRQSAEGSP